MMKIEQHLPCKAISAVTIFNNDEDMMSPPIDKQYLIEFETSFFVYEGFIPASIGICNLRIIYGSLKTVFLLSELVDNPGPSITNAIAEIWIQLQQKFPEKTKNRPLLIEHYDDRIIFGDKKGQNRYAEITIDKSGIKWTTKNQEQISDMAGIDKSLLMISPHILNTNMGILAEEARNEKPHFNLF